MAVLTKAEEAYVEQIKRQFDEVKENVVTSDNAELMQQLQSLLSKMQAIVTSVDQKTRNAYKAVPANPAEATQLAQRQTEHSQVLRELQSVRDSIKETINKAKPLSTMLPNAPKTRPQQHIAGQSQVRQLIDHCPQRNQIRMLFKEYAILKNDVNKFQASGIDTNKLPIVRQRTEGILKRIGQLQHQVQSGEIKRVLTNFRSKVEEIKAPNPAVRGQIKPKRG